MRDYDTLRRRMVETQLRARGITDSATLNAMAKVPREKFVPEEYRDSAYDDSPQPIGYGQTISQPYMVARMTELLELDDTSKALEIGTGCGYQTAVLAEIAGEVFSIEVVYELMSSARDRLRELGYTNVRIRSGDGARGWPEEGPFDGIIVTAAAPGAAPPALLDQLADGGRLVIPRGVRTQKLYRVTRNKQDFIEEELFPVRFVPLISAS